MMTTNHSPHRSGSRVWRGTLASALLVVGLLGGLAIHAAFANPASNQTIHACVNVFTGDTRIILPGRPLTCSAGEVLVDWVSATGDAPTIEVSEITAAFQLAAGETVTRDVSCPNDGEIAISGGGSANLVADAPQLMMNQSFRLLPDTWRVTMTNLDQSGDTGAIAQVFCTPGN